MIERTNRLYYSNGDLSAWKAKVVGLEKTGEGDKVILDETIFYPEGGGQPCDLGAIEGYPLEEVWEEDNVVIHRLRGESGLRIGMTVNLQLDQARRRHHTQQHSGQHLLSAILERDYAIHTIGFHLGDAYSTIDLSCPSLGADRQREIEDKAEALIVNDHPYLIHECDVETAATFPLRKKIPQGETSIRVAEISGYDWVACCGTHVRSARDIRTLAILSTERYKGNTRVYFLAGDRALAWLREESLVLGELAASLGTSTRDTKTKVESLAARSESQRIELFRLKRQRAESDIAMEILKNPCVVGKAVSFIFPDRDAEESAETAKAGARAGLDAVCLSEPDATVLISLAPEGWAGLRDEKAFFEGMKSQVIGFGGRGGGGKGNFRASFPSLAAAEDFFRQAICGLSGSTEG